MNGINALLNLLSDAKSLKPNKAGLTSVLQSCKTLELNFEHTAMILDSLEYGYVADSSGKFFFYEKFKFAMDKMPKS